MPFRDRCPDWAGCAVGMVSVTTTESDAVEAGYDLSSLGDVIGRAMLRDGHASRSGLI